jgi:putative transcriptional regulator
MDLEQEIELELALALAVPTPAPAHLRGRLLAAASGPLKYAPFARRVATFFGITRERAELALERLSDERTWIPMTIRGMRMAPVQANVPGLAMFLRLDAGAHCPLHRHLGEERILILEGSLIEDSGVVSVAGDVLIRAPGTRHSCAAPHASACVSAYLLEGGVEYR